MIAIVSAFRGVSTKADQAHIHFVSGSHLVASSNTSALAHPSSTTPREAWLPQPTRTSPLYSRPELRVASISKLMVLVATVT
jgi:hypothetical protein